MSDSTFIVGIVILSLRGWCFNGYSANEIAVGGGGNIERPIRCQRDANVRVVPLEIEALVVDTAYAIKNSVLIFAQESEVYASIQSPLIIEPSAAVVWCERRMKNVGGWNSVRIAIGVFRRRLIWIAD